MQRPATHRSRRARRRRRPQERSDEEAARRWRPRHGPPAVRRMHDGRRVRPRARETWRSSRCCRAENLRRARRMGTHGSVLVATATRGPELRRGAVVACLRSRRSGERDGGREVGGRCFVQALETRDRRLLGNAAGTGFLGPCRRETTAAATAACRSAGGRAGAAVRGSACGHGRQARGLAQATESRQKREQDRDGPQDAPFRSSLIHGCSRACPEHEAYRPAAAKLNGKSERHPADSEPLPRRVGVACEAAGGPRRRRT